MKNVLHLIIVLLIVVTTSAQDKSDIAVALYQKAESAFVIADYESALSSLQQAELTLGFTNTKLLYLKAKTLDMLTKVDGKHLSELKKAIDLFFAMVNKDTYPQNKYNEMILISIDLQQRGKEEEVAYNKVKSSTDISDYEVFFSKYPNSKYEAELRSSDNYQQLTTKPDLKADNELWLKDNAKAYKQWIAAPMFIGIPKRKEIEREAVRRGFTVEDLKKK